MTAAAALGTGAASGFFGIGGGFLIVPALIASTGMPVISGLVDWNIAAAFIFGGIGGGIAGMALATRLADRKMPSHESLPH